MVVDTEKLKSLPIRLSAPIVSKIQPYKNTAVTRLDPKVVRQYGLYQHSAEFEQYATEIDGKLAIVLIVQRRNFGLDEQASKIKGDLA